MWTSSFCVSDVIIALIEHGMSVNNRYPNLKVNSLLNHCIGKKSLAVVELLVERGANLHIQDGWGFTPIIRAAFYNRWNIFDFLLGRKEISRIERIEALELAGAVILSDVTPSHCSLPKEIEFWRESLRLRLMDADGSGPFIKNLPEKPGRIVEWTTSEELERVIQHRSEEEIQSFIIRLRILSTKSWAAVGSIYFDYKKRIRYDNSSQLNQFVAGLNIYWSLLETIPTFDSREKGLWETTSSVVCDLIFTLINIERDNLLNEKTIKTSLKLIMATDQLDDREFIERTKLFESSWMTWMYILIRLLARLPHLVNEDSMECLKELVQLDQRRTPFLKRKLLLHEPFEQNSLYSKHLIIPTVSLLLRAGADPNVGDAKGNGALHVLASKECNIDPSIQESVARLLLNAGAHLDRVNKEGKTAAHEWMTPWKLRWDQPEITPNKTDLPSWLRPDDPVPKLQCECAKVIRAHGVPYKHSLPPSLNRFVSWH